MTSPKTFYLVSACQGHVLAYKEKGQSGVVAENRGDQGDEEKWFVEQGDEPDVVAFRCAANGKYLNADPVRYANAGTGDRQWWKISFEGVRTPGTCRLHVVGSPALFLHNVDNFVLDPNQNGNQVRMFEWEVCYTVVDRAYDLMLIAW
jgi:hypothetical protein